MSVQLLILFLIVLVYGNNNSDRVRIIGGKDTTIKKHPYIVSLVSNGSHFCGASLINSKWALTSAHCMQFLKPEDLTVRANSTFLDNGMNISVRKIISHPHFRYVTGDSDIALIELDSPINCTYCQTIQLSTTTPKSGQNCTIVGWGTRTMKDEDPWPILQEAVIPVVDFDKCQDNYINISQPLSKNMFCAGFIERGGVDSCIGDSGGPVVINGKLAGIISWAYLCANPGFPGINTIVSNYLSWIKDVSGARV